MAKKVRQQIHRRSGSSNHQSTTIAVAALCFFCSSFPCSTAFSENAILNVGLHPLRPAAATYLLSQRESTPEISDSEIKISSINSTTTAADNFVFGKSVPFAPVEQRDEIEFRADFVDLDDSDDIERILKENRMKNIAVAIASFAIAIFNYCWQFTHPVTAVEILATMQKNSAPLTSIGNNGKPTVVDFWAPWCSNCKVEAPTLQAIEQEYGDRVNFILVNGDEASNWPLIELFGVDAIPHLALLSGEGDVETALIGPMSRNVLRADIDALLTKKDDCDVAPVEVPPVCHNDLPFKMFDAFANRQEGRRINFMQK